MDRHIRYEVLSGEDEHVPAEPVVLAMVIPPPVYAENRTEQSESEAEPLCQKLPSYEEATTLPSYEEAEKSKAEEARRQVTAEQQQQDDHDRITVAGRCGALSGLGLSIVKWVAIVKHNQWADGFAEADSWVWWLLILCGFMIFVRGAVQYAKIKYEWQKLNGYIRRYYLF